MSRDEDGYELEHDVDEESLEGFRLAMEADERRDLINGR